MTPPSPRGSAVTHRVRNWFRQLITFWTVIAVVSAIAISVFADLGEDVAEKSTSSFDNAVRGWMISHQNPVIFKIAHALTWIGSPDVMLLVAIGGGMWFYGRRGRSKAGVVIAAPAVGGMISGGVKLLFGRTRPAGAALFNEHTYSFPSGHATTSAAVTVTVCYVLAREGIISWTAAIVIGASVPLVVGLTRLYLDVHWATDVIAGWSVGLFVAAMSAALYDYHRRSAPPDVGAAGVAAAK
jgi:membrane-associated phospholipid phosphatase